MSKRDREENNILRVSKLLARGYSVDDRGRLVHREIYKHAYGSIPAGWVVHHVDGNKSNNTTENLVAIPRRMHDRLHSACRKNRQPLPSKKDILKQRDSIVYLEFTNEIKRLEHKIQVCHAEKEAYKQRTEKEMRDATKISVDHAYSPVILQELEITPIKNQAPTTILRKAGSSKYR
jgi:hypothetical protein